MTHLKVRVLCISEISSISECTVPFIIVGEWCYYLNETFLTYNDARQSCASANSHLAYITTEDEQLALESYLSGSGVESKHILY